MKITDDHQTELENLLTAQAKLRGAESLTEWITKGREAIASGAIPTPRKSEAVLLFSYLIHGEALRFICDTLYAYCNDTHLATFQERLFKKHAPAS